MNVKTACNLLNINPCHKLPTQSGLKKKYYAQCLHAHPDKNGNSAESNVRFQQINDAYSFLQIHIKSNVNSNESCSQHYTNQKSQTKPKVPLPHLYLQKIGKSIGNFIQKTSSSSIHNIDHTIITSIIKSIVSETHMDDTFSLIGSLNKSTREKIVLFIENYKNILNISSDTFELIRLVMLCDDNDDDSTDSDSNCEINQIFYLNPTLNDLFDNNIFKLVTNNQLFYVPLWFGESFFELECGEHVQVICNPILPNGVTIDDNNNLHTSIYIQQNKLNKLIQNNCCLSVFIGLMEFCISAVELSQIKFVGNLDSTLIYTYCIKEQGPSRAIPDDMYNITLRSDIFVSIFVNGLD
jgi:hypothetical protein